MVKHYMVLISFCLAVMLAAPLLALPREIPPSDSPDLPVMLPKDETEEQGEAKAFRLKLSQSGEIIELPIREYVFGVVAAEMSMNYHDEALKAQAVAAYTYALYIIERDSFDDFDLTDDPATHQAFITRAAAMEKWGEKAEENAGRLDKITAETENLVLQYEGKPILAAYHDTSCGRTIGASSLWGGNYPYLVSVESAGDLLSPSYQKETVLAEGDFAEICKNVGINLSGEAENWVENIEYNDEGTVKTLTICGSSLSGVDARKVFSLPSAAFDINYSPEVGFTFITRGNGHGVGMSQTGANYMALCGSPFAEILAWYYPQTQLVKQ